MLDAVVGVELITTGFVGTVAVINFLDEIDRAATVSVLCERCIELNGLAINCG